jgi:signal transduction histidine kinase
MRAFTLSPQLPSHERRRVLALAGIGLLLASLCPWIARSGYRGSEDLHAAMEAIGALLGLVTGFTLIARAYVHGNRFHLLIGLAYFVNGAEDFIHGALSFPFFHDAMGLQAEYLAQSIPGTYVTGRLLMGLILLAAPFVIAWFGPIRNPRRETVWVSLVVVVATAGLTAFAFQLPLPKFVYPDEFVSRPADFLSAVILFFALAGFLREYHQRRDILTWWIALSITINMVSQIAMSFSRSFYDPLFDIAHVYKVFGYLIPLVGFSLYQIALLKERQEAEAALRLDESRLETLLRLNQMTEASLQELTDFSLEEAVRLTKSGIGYLAFLNDEETVLTMHAWSKTAMKQCAIMDKPLVYPVGSTGLWGEAVRQRRAVITNDYTAPNPLKKGYPEGHVHVLRHMNTPVFDGKRIVAVAGVGNKEGLYDESDVRQLNLLMQGMWRLIQRKQAESQLQRQSALLHAINAIFREALTCDSVEEVAQKGLVVAQELTGSKFGLIGELNPAGRLDVLALTDPGWAVCQVPNPKLLLRNMEIHGIYGSAIRQGRPVISNDPASHPDRVGVPEGHPALTCFLGVPLMQDGRAIGLIGLANKKGGYDEADQRDVEALSVALLEALKRKRAEEDLRSLNVTLEQRVAERTALAEQRARELARSNAELQQFAYVASHDLQEPLRMVGSYTQLLGRRYQGRLDKDADEFIRYAVDGAHRMQVLINDLLAYARVDSRGKPFKSTDCGTVLDIVLTNLKVVIAEVKAVITRDPLPKIVADDTQLAQLFQNLIGNALKFCRKNAAPQIHIGATLKDGSWEFFIRDNGIGIAPEHFDRIFQIFQRLHTRQDYPGTGIGLAVCKKIVERHNGRIWVESQPNKGATFRFTLPQSASQTVPSSAQ